MRALTMAERRMESALPGDIVAVDMVRSSLSGVSGDCKEKIERRFSGCDGEKLAGKGETDLFLDNFQLFHRGAAGPEVANDFIDQVIRGGGAGREADVVRMFEPFRLDLRGAVDQVGGDAVSAGHFAQPDGIRAVARSDHQQKID